MDRDAIRKLILENLSNYAYGVNPLIAIRRTDDTSTGLIELYNLVSEGLVTCVTQKGCRLFLKKPNIKRKSI